VLSAHASSILDAKKYVKLNCDLVIELKTYLVLAIKVSTLSLSIPAISRRPLYCGSYKASSILEYLPVVHIGFSNWMVYGEFNI